MIKNVYQNYKILVLVVVVFFCVSSFLAYPFRSSVVSFFSAAWDRIHGVSELSRTADQRKIHRLEMENRLLHDELERVKQVFFHERLLNEHIADLSNSTTTDFYYSTLQTLLEKQLQAVPAKVVFRDFASWSSFCWINVGEKTNREIGAPIVAINSPIVVGNAVVGVIDQVTEERARVALLSDPALHPSVRVARGKGQNDHLLYHIGLLTEALLQQGDRVNTTLLRELNEWSGALQAEQGQLYLAKGSVEGQSTAHRLLLRGTGFNYDYPDQFGPARDLRTGEVIGDAGLAAMPLIQKGDILHTTGMDGIFPPGLMVGVVAHCYPLQEGGYYYDADIIPAVGDLNNIVDVFVLPPLVNERGGAPL